jgi:hypothetical protein
VARRRIEQEQFQPSGTNELKMNGASLQLFWVKRLEVTPIGRGSIAFLADDPTADLRVLADFQRNDEPNLVGTLPPHNDIDGNLTGPLRFPAEPKVLRLRRSAFCPD